MDLADVRLLIDYNYWARDRMIAAVTPLSTEQYTRDLASSFKSVRDTLVHTYSAEWVWYSRWQGTSPTSPIPFDRFPDLAALQSAWLDLEARLRSFFDQAGEAGIARAMDYKLLNGQPGRTVLWQMLQHMVNHGSYHRGQITTMLRQLGAQPPKSVDLITFYREQVGN